MQSPSSLYDWFECAFTLSVCHHFIVILRASSHSSTTKKTIMMREIYILFSLLQLPYATYLNQCIHNFYLKMLSMNMHIILVFIWNEHKEGAFAVSLCDEVKKGRFHTDSSSKLLHITWNGIVWIVRRAIHVELLVCISITAVNI